MDTHTPTHAHDKHAHDTHGHSVPTGAGQYFSNATTSSMFKSVAIISAVRPDCTKVE
jgi:hypothetical protein